MLNMLFSKTRRMIVFAGIGLFAANCLMADLLPSPTRHRPRPVPLKDDPQPVRPYVERSQPKVPEPLVATMYGRLIYLGANATKDANYALYQKDGEKIVPVCFFMWEGRGLEKYLNHDVKVTGFVKEMKGWTCPLLIFEYLENVEFLHQGETIPKQPAAVFTPADPKSAPPPQPEPVKPLPPPAVKPQPAVVPPPQPVQPLPPSKPVKPAPVVVPPPLPNPVSQPKPQRVQPQQVVVPPPFPNPVPQPKPQPALPLPPVVVPQPQPQPVQPLPPVVVPQPQPAPTLQPLPPPEPVTPPPEPQPKPAQTLQLLPPPETVKPLPKSADAEPLLPPPQAAQPLPPPPPEVDQPLPPPDAGRTKSQLKSDVYRPVPPARQFHR